MKQSFSTFHAEFTLKVPDTVSRFIARLPGSEIEALFFDQSRVKYEQDIREPPHI